jgi:hypothetical protein
MQGILKSNHQRLCDCLHDVKIMQPVADHKLNELEEELHAVFKSYEEKMRELKRLIIAYEEKEKSIKNEIKRIRKFSMVVSKRMEKPVLNKAVVLIVLLLHRIFINTCNGAGFSDFL